MMANFHSLTIYNVDDTTKLSILSTNAATHFFLKTNPPLFAYAGAGP